ncbi:CD225/dispanin family protein [Actinotalea fermentans]|uniref:Interferon-induced transmembrane protein n=1 Tax=Actinotalea fermentans TaxID=43671 RepID=A0A511YV44_9CELL|nr:CD225/dispanin family protein [Actinotalea fermentans]KGM16843.1 hypothetical protein N867_14835 [Actinotalea fermentans ATCC 43279 = JCM 9966 = DSM 3133]GEN79072.1 hypothetical protein AFE02nite_08060 [Actinotalea fermentans]
MTTPTGPQDPFGSSDNPYGQQPPAPGQQPPSPGQQPPAYGQQPPAYGQQPPAYGQGGYPSYPQPGGYGGGYGAGGYGGGGYNAAPPPQNYLVWAILSTVLCCLPLGIVSIVFATQVNSKWAAGDVAGAQESARKAKNFAIWGAVVGLVVSIVYLVGVFALGWTTTTTSFSTSY